MNLPEYSTSVTAPPSTENEKLAVGFREALRTPGKSTHRAYGPKVLRFSRWMDLHGLGPSTLPADAPTQFYQWAGLLGSEKAADRGVYSSALRGFSRWLRTSGHSVPELSFPVEAARLKKPKRPKEQSSQESSTPMTVAPETSASGAVHSDGNGTGGAAYTSGGAPAPPLVVPEQELSGLSTEPVTAPASVPLVLASTPAPLPPRPPVMPTSPSLGEPLKPQKSLDSRQDRARDPLRGLLPVGGLLRIYRVSDGSDGVAPGNRVLVGEYSSNDLDGHDSAQSFLRACVHSYLEPRLRHPTTTYIVERVDDRGTRQGLPHKVAMATGTVAVDATPGNTVAASNLDAASTGAEVVLRSQAEELRRQLADERASWEARIREVEERGKSGHGGGVDLFMWKMLMEREPPKPPSVEELVGKLKAGVDEERTVLPPAPVSFAPPPPQFIPEPREDGTGQALERLTGLVERLATERMGSERAVPAPQPTPTDPVALFQQSMAFLSQIVPKQTPVEQSPALVQMQQMISQQSQQIATLTAKLEGGGDIAKEVSKMRTLQQLMRELSGDAGGGASGFLEQAFQALPDVLDGIAKVVKAGRFTPLSEQPLTTKPEKGKPQGPQQNKQIPPLAVEALRQMAAALPGADAVVVNGMFKLIEALHSDQVFVPLGQKMIQRLQAVQTKSELRQLVGLILEACGAKQLATPEMTDKITQAMFMRFAEVSAQLGQSRRLVDDEAGEDSAGVDSSDTPVAPVSPVTQPPPSQVPTPPQAPTPAPPPPPAPDDSESDGSEESEDVGDGEE